MKITNYKSQITNKFQITNSKPFFGNGIWIIPMGHEASWQLAIGKEEDKKISLRFPQTFEATALFSIHVNGKRVLPAGWFREGNLYMARMRLLWLPSPRAWLPEALENE